MTLVPLTLHLPDHLIDAARGLCDRRDITLGQLIRDAVDQELRRSRPKTRNCADEALVARLQRLLPEDIAAATGWDELDRALRHHGFRLQPAGGGLTLHDMQGRRLCKSSELGFGYARFVRRFGCPMPGHPHKMAHLLNDREADDDFAVIEPF